MMSRSLHTPCKPMFTGHFLFTTCLTTELQNRHTTYLRWCKQPTNTHANPTPPPTTLPPTWKCINVLLCLGNIVIWCKAPLTMLPGHGSTLMWLPHWHQSFLSSPYTAMFIPSHQRHRKCQNCWVPTTTTQFPGPCNPQQQGTYFLLDDHRDLPLKSTYPRHLGPCLFMYSPSLPLDSGGL